MLKNLQIDGMNLNQRINLITNYHFHLPKIYPVLMKSKEGSNPQ